MSQLEIPFSIKVTNAVAVDYYYGPWANRAAAIAGVPEAIRTRGLTVFLLSTNSKWIWKNGTTDNDLVADGAGGNWIEPTTPPLDPEETSATLESKYSEAQIGDVYFSENYGIKYTKIKAGVWTMDNLNIA